MTNLNASRRKFLRTASVVSGSVGAAAAPFALNLATLGSAVAQTTGPYKAIVCLFMYGGTDRAGDDRGGAEKLATGSVEVRHGGCPRHFWIR